MDSFLYLALKHMHSVLRWLLLSAVFVSVGYSFLALYRKKGLSAAGSMLARISLYLAHFQLLIGVVVYFVSPKVQFSASSMKDPVLRFYLVEHVLAMVVAIALITLGYAGAKKALTPVASSRRIFWYYGIALVLILLLIPWPFLSYGASWI